MIEEIYRLFREHPAISTDSRQIIPGSIFFALKGETFNGNRFAETALASGASFAVVDEPEFATSDACILVPDVLSALQAMASLHRSKFNIPIIGITGSNGKTTTKELISRVLSQKYNVVATRGNLNNHIGVPLTLLGITEKTEIAVIEMGANHPGEIDSLCRIARPGYGIITNIGKAHLEGFGGFGGVVMAKTELYRYLREQKGTIFLNNDDALLREHSSDLETYTYGIGEGNVVAGNIQADPFVTMEVRFPDGDVQKISTRLYGMYNAANILAAACIGSYFTVPVEEIKSALEAYHPENNRSQVLRTEKNLLILDAYNANPGSMKTAIDAFAKSSYPDKVVILGDMLELGQETETEHLAILDLLAQYEFKQIMLVGPVFTALNTRRDTLCFTDSALARMWLNHHRIENSTILIKGSRGIRLEGLAEAL